MGYKAKGEEIMDAPLDIIFNKDNFMPVFNQDIVTAKKEILIVSPFARQRRTHQNDTAFENCNQGTHPYHRRDPSERGIS